MSAGFKHTAVRVITSNGYPGYPVTGHERVNYYNEAIHQRKVLDDKLPVSSYHPVKKFLKKLHLFVCVCKLLQQRIGIEASYISQYTGMIS